MSLVGLQIALIASSFLTLVYLESEWLELGTSIDYAGLNRFLTVNTILETHSLDFNSQVLEKPESLEKLKENLLLIKEGGKKNNNFVKKLPSELEKDWEKTYEDYVNFEKSISIFLTSNPDNRLELQIEVDNNGRILIQSSDILVSEITLFLLKIDAFIINLQIVLLLVNTIVHVLLVLLIFRILNNFANEKISLEKFAIIGKIGANIAHDLRNPLTVIKGSFEILKMKNHNMEKTFEKKQYQKIDDSIKKIEYLTKDILDFAKTKELNKEKISFLELIQEAIDEFKIPSTIKINLPIHDYKIHVDKIKFQNVISNLIKNSLDEICENGNITIDLHENDDNVLFTIEDSGNTLSEKELPQIFEPLYTTKQTGTGLGLMICKKIIEQHGGTINVSVNPTTFTVSLPKN